MAFDKNKIHLVPIVVLDIINILNEKNLNSTQRDAHIERLEVTRDYINTFLDRSLRKAA